MVFGGVGPGNQDHIGFFDIADGICHGATAECCGQTGHGGGMSEPGAMIDIVGFKNRPGKFLGNIIFFIGDPGGGQNTDTVGPVFIFYGSQALGHQIQGFIPGGLPELAVFP